eukprot:Colp12_sorted_trinity150504_noHs@10078
MLLELLRALLFHELVLPERVLPVHKQSPGERKVLGLPVPVPNFPRRWPGAHTDVRRSTQVQGALYILEPVAVHVGYLLVEGAQAFLVEHFVDGATTSVEQVTGLEYAGVRTAVALGFWRARCHLITTVKCNHKVQQVVEHTSDLFVVVEEEAVEMLLTQDVHQQVSPLAPFKQRQVAVDELDRVGQDLDVLTQQQDAQPHKKETVIKCRRQFARPMSNANTKATVQVVQGTCNLAMVVSMGALKDDHHDDVHEARVDKQGKKAADHRVRVLSDVPLHELQQERLEQDAVPGYHVPLDLVFQHHNIIHV